jgi:hypothetical protein
MSKQFGNEHCLFCQRPSSRSGEHVLPTWLLKMFDPADGPYRTFVDGKPQLDRVGRHREHSSAVRVKVPMCEQHNAALDRRFETSAKPVIRRIFESEGSLTLSAVEARTAGTWFVKTWLLLAHPRARPSHPEFMPSPWTPVGSDLYGWMVTGQPLPDGLSLWLTRGNRQPSGRSKPRRIPLPTVRADGAEIEFQSLQFGLRSLEISLVYHPGWAIDHPLERERRAVRFWPLATAEPIDLSALPSVGPNDTNWLKGPRVGFKPGTYRHAALPPLSEATRFQLRPGLIEFVFW